MSFFEGKTWHTQRYNDQTFKVQIFLDSNGDFSDNEENRYYINPAAIFNLTIDETVNSWNTAGSLAFLYLPDDTSPEALAGNSDQASVTGAAQDNGKVVKGYQFRGDGYDLLRVIIHPADQEGGPEQVEINSSESKWVLSYLFSIEEIEDVNNIPGFDGPLAPYMKCAKVYFKDVREQLLRTTNLEYSTAQSPEANWQSGMSNEGVLKTGLTILEIFNKAVGDPNMGGNEHFKESLGPDWDEGAAEIFYTSPADYSAEDDIDYVLGNHLSKDGVDVEDIKDYCLMTSKRSEQDAKDINRVCLIPMYKYFDKAVEGDQAGPYQNEHFFVTDIDESYTSQREQAPRGATVEKEYKAPFSSNQDRDLKTAKFGQIISYSFVDMSPKVNSENYVSSPVYSVDVGKRVFKVKFTQNDVETSRQIIGNKYISKLYNKGGNPEDLFLPTINETKKNVNVFPSFSLNGVDNLNSEILRQKNGISQLLYTGLFQNACICFTVNGLTLREPGTIIGIDKASMSESNDYYNKVYGQYFVIRVLHVFEAGTYMNQIYALKLHRYRDAETPFNKTL